MSVVGKVHAASVAGRRVSVLSSHLAKAIPSQSSVLDVGCGDGQIAKLIMGKGSFGPLEGIDVLVREGTAIPIKEFDGQRIPHPDKSFDVVMFVDVLHHTDDPMIMLREANRVARRAVVIKDHLKRGLLAGPTLRFMDWVGNAPHGVRLPYNYWTPAQWERAFKELRWQREEWITDVGLYPAPANWIFGRGLHFIGRWRTSEITSS